MQVWSQAATLAKNSLAADTPFLLFVEVISKDLAEPVRLVRNTEDIVWRNSIWTAFPIEVESSSEDGKTIPSINIRVSNCGGMVGAYLQRYNGLVDSEIHIYVILASNTESKYPEFELNFLITEAKYTESWITFVLGASSELVNRFPLFRYNRNFCPFKCGDIRCGYVGDGNCVNTLDSCLIPKRFGGEPGMVSA
ncbi:MAG: DUF1833 family protein [Lachnospiraceae bacterium]|nr:DUF1833 family protein [Lachnospiraceae bacterium]